MGICISSSTTKTVKTSNHDASVNISDHVAADNKKADDDVSELEPFPKTTYNTFVELILIERILFNQENVDVIKSDTITSYLADCGVGKNQVQSCYEILSLLKKHGLKKYLDIFYRDSHCVLIELIVQHVIMKHYTNEYRNEISMTNNNNDNSDKYFECKLFNQVRLIPQIFSYLELNNITNCSKVNFVWLIHAFDHDSLKYLNFYLLVNYRYCINRHCTNYRIRQRCCNVTRLQYNNMKPATLSKYNLKPFDIGKNLGYFQNVTSFSIQFDSSSVSSADVLFLQELERSSDSGIFNTNKIWHFEAMSNYNYQGDDPDYSDSPEPTDSPPEWVKRGNYDYVYKPSNTYPVISPSRSYPVIFPSISLHLPNVKMVKLHNVKFNVILSNKCQILDIGKFTLYPSMIKKCDLSGIKRLTIDNISIGKNYNSYYYDRIDYEQMTKDACDLFAKKLTNIKEIRINRSGDDTLLLWNALQACKILDKNDCNVCVSFAINHEGVLSNEQVHDPHAYDYTGEHEKLITAINNNSESRVTDIKLCLENEECIFMACSVMNSINIRRQVQVIRMSRFGNKDVKKNMFCDYMKYFSSDVKRKDFVKLKCMDCDFRFWDELDWAQFCHFFDMFNNNNNYNYDNDQVRHIRHGRLNANANNNNNNRFEMKWIDDHYISHTDDSDISDISSDDEKNINDNGDIGHENMISALDSTQVETQGQDEDEQTQSISQLGVSFIVHTSQSTSVVASPVRISPKTMIVKHRHAYASKESLFWNVNIEMNWPDPVIPSEMEKIFGYVKKLCQCVNESFIKLNNAINFKIEFIAQSSHDELFYDCIRMQQMEKFNDKAKQMKILWQQYCKNEFLKIFDNLKFIIQDNCVQSNEKYQSDTIAQMKAANDKCQPLSKCYVWTKYTFLSHQCKIEFGMKNAFKLYKNNIMC